MDDNGIPTSPHWIVDHLDPVDEAQFIEAEDYIVIRGEKLDKPFVEKPVRPILTCLLFADQLL